MVKIVATLSSISTAVILGMFAYLGRFARPMADDYCSIYFVQRLGVLRSVWYWYINWHGGFSASLADGLLGLIGPDIIGIIPPLMLMVWFFSLAWAIVSVFRFLEPAAHRSMSIALSMLILFGTLLVSPAPSASLIWWSGLRGYAPPLIIVTIYMALYLRFRSHGHNVNSQYIWYALSFGILFISGGFSEPFTPLQVIIVLLMLVAELHANREAPRNPNTMFLAVGTLGGIVALVVMVIAPGNAFRQQFYPAPPALLEIFFIAWTSYYSFLAGLSFDLLKLAAVVTVFGCSMLFGTCFPESKYFSLRNMLIILMLGLFFAFCNFVPAAYGQSSEPSHTSLITPVYLLMIMLSTLGVMSGGMLMKSWQTTKAMHAILSLLLVLSSLGYSTVIAAQRLSHEIVRAAVYAEHSNHRDLTIRRARKNGLGEVFVPPIPRWITLEPTDNTNFFVNRCMSLYYGIDILSSPDANE